MATATEEFVVRADEKLTPFLELETAIRPTSAQLHFLTKPALAKQFAPQGNHAEQSETKQRNCRAAIGHTHYRRYRVDLWSCFNRLENKNHASYGQEE